MQPIEMCSSTELLSRMPERARNDLLEWSSALQVTRYLDIAFSSQASGQGALDPQFQIRITDDQPYNEYFFLRRYGLL